MNTFRYVMAILMLVGFPPAFGFWFLVHPFIRFWRKLGPTITYTITLGLFAVTGVVIYRFRDVLLAEEYGTNYGLIAVAVPLFVATGVIARRRGRYLTFKILAGLPQLAPEKHPRKLLTEGIYGRIRHPRYVEAALGFIAWSLLINYLAVYVLVGLSLVSLYVVVLLEERELREHFGDEYVEYCAGVPRFVPRFHFTGNLKP
ncbi:MAG: isoprenylcysteine carboxylmethyltransferase family protein [bacterium]|nr:isoprenylcysteine carboxylmethyltransferase family protein [bacterium]